MNFKTFLYQENLLNILTEALRTDQIQTFNKTIEELQLQPPDNLKDIIIGDSASDFLIRTTVNNNETDVKISKVVKNIYPDITVDNLRHFIEKYKANMSNISENIKFKFVKASQCYNFDGNSKLKSCMTNDKGRELIKIYDSMPVKGLILYNNDVAIGRSLLWDLGSQGKYLDRIYPSEEPTIVNIFQTYANNNGWKIRKSQKPEDFYNPAIGNLTVSIQNINLKNKLPYFDSFRYGILENGNLLLSTDEEYIKSKNGRIYCFDKPDGCDLLEGDHLLKQIQLSNDSTYEIEQSKNGKWVINMMNGTWKNGVFDGGYWEDGVFDGGTFKNGDWLDGTFKNGTWVDGSWDSGVWENGNWETGWISDVSQRGNYEPDWIWNNLGEVQSPISPKEYFTTTN